VYYKATLEYQF